MSGFGQTKTSAERSLEKSSRELKALRKIIERYKDDPQGKRKMLKKMQKYWRSNLSIVQGMDSKPGVDVMKSLEDDLNAVSEVLDPRPEVDETESKTNLKNAALSAIRDIMSKDPKEIANAESAPEV